VATGGQSQVTLNWSGFSDAGSGMGSYRLYYSSTDYPDLHAGVKIYEGAATSFVHRGLPNGATCFYRVYAVDKVGNISAGAPATARTLGTSMDYLLLLLEEVN